MLPVVDKVATGENLKRLMRLKHISVSQLQMRLGMPSATNIYMWCRGEFTPSADRLVQIASILECTIDDILIISE